MASVSIETRTNGDHDHRTEKEPPHSETREELIDRTIVELHGLIHRIGVGLEVLRTDQTAIRGELAAMATNFDVLQEDQKTIRKNHSEMMGDVRRLAEALHAKRTLSGSLSLSLPPSATAKSVTDTGSHIVVDKKEQEAYEAQFEEINRQLEEIKKEKLALQREREREADRREGADALRKQQEAEKKADDAKKDARAARIQRALGIIAVIGPIVVGVLTELRHMQHTPVNQAPTTTQRTP